MELLKNLNSFIWGIPMLLLLLGTHLFFTIRLKFIQKHVFTGIRNSIKSETEGHGEQSGFAALATTLAATLGTGNIIGVSTAIALGGPGAIFWCWLTGILGMATTYAESYLSILFRQKKQNGSYVGGPMYLLEYGLHNRLLAVFYASCTLVASFGVGCTTQSNAITSTTSTLWHLSPKLVGFLVAIPVGLVILGGIKSIGRICTKLVPAMGLFYIIGCITILVLNSEYILHAITVIFTSVFTSSSLAGGVIGGTIQTAARYGIARGLFTNEAGLGSAGIAAASAITKDPKRQSLISMTATFWDTVVMCAITGLVIITNMLKNPQSILKYTSGELTTAAFESIPNGEFLLGISIICFAIATLLGWSYFGEQATIYLYGQKNLKYYQLAYIVMIYIGAVMNLDLVWELTDFINAFMAIPCIYALIRLSKHIQT